MPHHPFPAPSRGATLRRRALEAALAVLLWSIAASAAHAIAIVGDGTAKSCTNYVVNKAIAGGGSLRLNCGPDPITVTLKQCYPVAANLQLDGRGLVTLRPGPGCGNAEFFSVFAAGSLTLTNITLAGAPGTAIRNLGTTTLTNATLAGNGGETYAGAGGAIYNDGTLTVNNSVFVGNRTTTRGGAIFGTADAKTAIINSTFVDNAARSGGALFLERGVLANVTLLHNVASIDGGAISNPHLAQAAVVMRNSIAVDNPSGDGSGNCAPTGFPDFVLAGVVDGGGNVQFPDHGCAPSIPAVDPRLLPPGYYGGTSLVAPLAADSPFADRADEVSCPSVDQRGRPRARVANGFPVCSPGAVEISADDVSPVVTAVEYYYPARDHYLLTPLPAEIAALDGGRFAGWVRTGRAIPVLVDTGQQLIGTLPVCRFYGRPEAGLDSHFYSATPDECAYLLDHYAAAWQLESAALFSMVGPDHVSGECPAGTDPVYRLYNNRADVNHRYTEFPAVRAAMIALAWLPEGFGPDAVAWCAVRD